MKHYLSKLLTGVSLAYAVFCSSAGFAQTQDLTRYNTGATGFMENKGQIVDQNHALNSSVKYLFNNPGFNVQLRQTGFSYDTYTDVPNNSTPQMGAAERNKLPKSYTRNFNRVDVELLGSNPEAQIIALGKSKMHYNYLNTGAPKGVGDVHYYNKVVYKNIYPHIDLEFFTSTKTQTDVPVEYQFIIHAGGNPADIKLSYNGADNLALNNGKLVVGVNAGSFTENIPASYFTNGPSVHVDYKLVGSNVFSFSLPDNLTIKSDLIIDPVPNLDWGTLYGGRSTDEAFAIAIDPDSNNVYVTGGTLSSSNIATAGAYSATYNSSYDVFVAKFDSGGTTLFWGTYYGGSGLDLGRGIAVDENKNVYITGYTTTTSGLTSLGAYQGSNAGGDDAFAAEFSADGTTLLWGTFFGGSGLEQGYGIALDANDSVYITGVTASTSGISKGSVYQTTNAGGDDAYLAEFNPNNTGSAQLVWSTYYGGTANDFGRGIAIDANTNIYITGYSGSNTTSMTTTGAFQTANAGSSDNAFIAEFNATGSTLNWGTYYGGSTLDMAFAIALGATDSVYITGESESNNLPITVGAYDSIYGTTGFTTFGQAFIAKFNPNNTGHAQLDWATYYGQGNCPTGGPPAIPPLVEGFGIAVDANDSVYITGEIEPGQCSVIGITRANAWEPSPSGFENAFVARFDPHKKGTHQLSWGTYFNGTGNSFGEGITLSGDNSVFVTGYLNGTANSKVVTSGAYQQADSGGWDVFVARFDTVHSGGRSASGIIPVSDNSSILVYPTLLTGNMALNVAIPANNTGLFDIYDLLGRKSIESELLPGSNQLSLSSYNLVAGLYLYRVTLNDNSVKEGKLELGQ